MTTDTAPAAPEAERAFQRDLDMLQTLPSAVLERLIDPEAAPAPPPTSVKDQLRKLSSSTATNPAADPSPAESPAQPAPETTGKPPSAEVADAVALSDAYIKEMREKAAELAQDEEGSGRSLEFRSRIERVREVAEGVQGAVEEYAKAAGV